MNSTRFLVIAVGIYVCAALHTSRQGLLRRGERRRRLPRDTSPVLWRARSSPSPTHIVSTRNEGLAIMWLTDQLGHAALSRRSHHLPPSVIVHAGRIQRVVRSPPIWLIERTHAGACGQVERRIRPIPMPGRTDRNE